MENNVDFHGVPPNELERNIAIKELNDAQKKLEAAFWLGKKWKIPEMPMVKH